mmetsp:Transcript_1366/g.3586  ORF Transcript_1366/g.3586 Transcript_1366/m.3586 type:complete len:324 (+) Transcript_1366:354-1325(+)
MDLPTSASARSTMINALPGTLPGCNERMRIMHLATTISASSNAARGQLNLDTGQAPSRDWHVSNWHVELLGSRRASALKPASQQPNHPNHSGARALAPSDEGTCGARAASRREGACPTRRHPTGRRERKARPQQPSGAVSLPPRVCGASHRSHRAHASSQERARWLAQCRAWAACVLSHPARSRRHRPSSPSSCPSWPSWPSCCSSAPVCPPPLPLRLRGAAQPLRSHHPAQRSPAPPRLRAWCRERCHPQPTRPAAIGGCPRPRPPRPPREAAPPAPSGRRPAASSASATRRERWRVPATTQAPPQRQAHRIFRRPWGTSRA